MTRFSHALANNLILFFASIAAAGLLLGVFAGPFETIAAAGTEVSSSAEAAQGQQIIEHYWMALPFTIAVLGLIQLLAAAAAEARTP